MDSKIKYLKDQLAELSTDWSVFNTSQNTNISADIMIYLPLKETNHHTRFNAGLSDFILKNFNDCQDYSNEIAQFEAYRETVLRQTLIPDFNSINCLIEYYNSLTLIEKRFFRFSQCDRIHFTWYDALNGEQSTQKSIQLEKASIIFNCAALYTQIAAVRQNGHSYMLDDQKLMWQSAAGCMQFLNTNFSNSPSFDMKNSIVEIFIDILMSQAYEIDAKILLQNIGNRFFINFINLAKIYAHVRTSKKIISNFVLT